MSTFTVREVESMQTLHHGAVRLVAAELGVESFGMQLLDLPAGFSEYPEHDHAYDRMEEVYVVLDGFGEFEIDGERVPVNRELMLRVGPDAKRKLFPGPQGVRILAIGCAPGERYQRPDAFKLEAVQPAPRSIAAHRPGRPA